MSLRAPTQDELEQVEQTRQAYRKMWAKLKNVPERKFLGTREDIDALNFIEYEAGDHPNGLIGAANIFGGVLVNTGVVMWAVCDELNLVLVNTLEVHDFPKVMVSPFARLLEIEHSSWTSPPYSRFDWLLEDVALRLYVGGVREDEMRPFLALIDRRENTCWEATMRAADAMVRQRPLCG